MKIKKAPSPEDIYRKRAKKYASKVKAQIKKQGLRTGELLLEYWKGKPSPMNMKELDLKQEDIIDIVEQEISKYKSSLPT